MIRALWESDGRAGSRLETQRMGRGGGTGERTDSECKKRRPQEMGF